MKSNFYNKYKLILTGMSLLFGLVLGGCKRSEPTSESVRPVRAIRVAGPEEYMQRSFPGLASASTEVNLSFRVGGPLISRPVKVGDTVEAGDVVARIDPRDFEVRLESIRGNLERAKATKDYAQTEFDRIQRIMNDWNRQRIIEKNQVL